MNLRPIASNPFLASRKIVFGSRPTERGFYRYASWIEPPPSRLLVLLRSRMEALGQIREVQLKVLGRSQ